METKQENAMEIQKDFPVGKERLYQAWTNTEELKQWWKPLGNSLAEVNIDLKERGTIKYVFIPSGDASSFIITGEYIEVKEKEKLVYTWNWHFPQQTIKDENFKLTVSFQDIENGSRLSVVQEPISEGETLNPNREGWEKSLEALHKYLNSPYQNGDVKVSGYNESIEQQKIGGYTS